MLPAISVYIKIFNNRVHIRNIDDKNDIELAAEEPFTTERLLIGTFTAARATLTRGIKIVTGKKVYGMNMLMHPMEKVDGGLSQVEDRVIRDLGLSLGAQNVTVWLGKELNDEEALNKLGHGP